MRRKLFALMLCISAITAFAYNAPLGTKILTLSNTFDKVYLHGMRDLPSPPTGSDCYAMVMKMNIKNGDKGDIFSIRNKQTDITLLNIGFNSQGRIVVSRHFNQGMVNYEIYDKLLNFSGTGSKQYEFRIFLCRTFIWLEVINASNTDVTPIFWGIDLPEVDLIRELAYEGASYELVFGGLQNEQSKLVHSDFYIYTSKYTDLKNDIIRNYIPGTQTRATIPTNIEKTENTQDLIKIYPLPVSETLNVDFNLKEAGDVYFEFYNMQGALLFKQRRSYSTAGMYHERFSREEIAGNNNMAILLIRINNEVITKKIICR